jgi:hypothetical protein
VRIAIADITVGQTHLVLAAACDAGNIAVPYFFRNDTAAHDAELPPGIFDLEILLQLTANTEHHRRRGPGIGEDLEKRLQPFLSEFLLPQYEISLDDVIAVGRAIEPTVRKLVENLRSSA